MRAPIYFYYPNSLPKSVDYKSGLDCWILKTYLILKENNSNLNISIGNLIPDKGIILFHKGFFPKNKIPNKSQLFVCIQADYGRYKYAQCHIMQNPAGLNNFSFSKKSYLEELLFSFSKSSFIAHWNQDNIMSRLVSRANTFKNVCFYGVTQNFPKELLDVNFKNKLADYGIELKVITDSELWNDYAEADCVLAIRDFDNKPHYNKPSSKIINSYIAGVPVISGVETSAVYLKNKVKINLPIVTSSDECFEAILKMKNEYESKLTEVKTDNTKLNLYHDDCIVLEWEKLLEGLQQNYRMWQRSSALTKKIFFQFCKF